MTATDSNRPQPGKLTASTEWAMASEEYDLARAGKGGEAVLAAAMHRQETAANELHYLLRKLSEEFDFAARKLEQGERRYALNTSSWHTDLPIKNVALNLASQAVEEARRHLETAAQNHPYARAYRLEQAADTLDASIGEMGLKGAHPLGSQIRDEANSIREAHDAAETARRDEGKAKAAAEKAKRIARPMGVTERKVLHMAKDGDGLRLSYRFGKDSDMKAAKRLVERGYLVKVSEPTGTGTIEWKMTDAGAAAAKAMSAS